MARICLAILFATILCIGSTLSAGAQTTVFSDDFEASFSGWTTGGSVDWYTGTPKNGTHSIRVRTTESFERTISTADYDSISVSFYLGAYSLDNSNENVEATWYDGSSWNLLKRINNGDPEEDQQLHYFQYSLPASADDNASFALRFKINGSGTGDYGYVDDVVVEGTSTSGGGEVLVYPDQWSTWNETALVSGALSDLQADDQVYMNFQCNTSAQTTSIVYWWNTSYTPSQVSKITYEWQFKGGRSDTPTYMLGVSHGSNENWDSVWGHDWWPTTDQTFTWETTQVSTYLTSDGVMRVDICGCPQNSTNYNTYLDLVRIKLELVGGGPTPPVADFSGSPTSGLSPLTVNFTDQSSNSPTSWDWTFGDGGSSTAQNPSHQYTGAGNYTVSLTADNADGSDTETKTNYISVTALPPAPVADFSGNPLSGAAPLTIYFTDLSSNSPTSWDWTFGDGGSSTAQNPSHQYAGAGSYTVSLTADNAGGSDTETKTNYISVTVPAPVAAFSGSPTSGTAPLTVNFTDQSSNSPTSWDWAFGDGGSSTAQNPSHDYTSAGDYTVSLTAGNAGGSDTETKTSYISVTSGPSEVLVYPTSWRTYENASVTVVSGGLGDVESDDGAYMVVRCDTSNQDYSIEYTWDTGYTPAEVTKITVEYEAHCTESNTPASMSHFTHANGVDFTQIKGWGTWPTSDQWFTWETTAIATYMTSAGTMVLNWCGCSQNGNNYDWHTDVMRIRLELAGGGPPPAPVAEFSGSPTSGTAPLTVNFTDLSSNSPTSWDWTFGDGGSSAAENPSHNYTSAGNYTVSLTADNAGGSDTETKTNYISVTVVPPVAAFSGSPASGTVPLTVSFTDQSSNAPTSWDWTFGDGGSSTAQNPSHQYTGAGNYTVSLTAGNAGGSDTETKTNYISVTVVPPVAAFSGSPTSGDAPLTVNFTDLSTNSPTSWSWTFGDGGSSTARHPSHQYTSAGDYTVSLTATNAGGSDGETKSNYISVTEGGPSTVTVYPSSWQDYGGDGAVTITSGSLADVDANDNVYMVAQCNTGSQQSSMEFTFNSGYSQGEVSRIRVKYDLRGTSSSTPSYMFFIKQGDSSNFTELRNGTWSTSDQIFTWETTDIATYLGSGGTLVTSICGCPQNSTNYSTYLDLISIELELGGGGAQAPVAEFSASPTGGAAPLTVNFTDQSSYSPISWNWTFGDGGSSTAQNPSHEYTSTGDYTVSLTASNAQGQDTETKTDYISVTSGRIVNVSTVSQLESAINNAQDGDTIMIADGTYQLNGLLFLGGRDDITIRGASGDPTAAVLRGQGFASMDSGDDILRLHGCSNVTIAYLTFEECHAYGIKCEDTSYEGKTLVNINIHDCHFYNIGMRMIKGTHGDPATIVDTGSIRNCHFENTKIPGTGGGWTFDGDYITAIDMMVLKDWVIADNTFKNIKGANGNARGAIFAWVGCQNVIAERNVITGCDRGICYGNPSYSSQSPTTPHNTGGVIRNNFIVVESASGTGMEICWANGVKVYHNTVWTDDETNGNGIHHFWEEMTNVHIANNIVRGLIYGDEPGVTKENNLTSGIQNSWFVDVASGDLHLTASATPAIDQVDRLADCPEDYDGQQRPTAAGMADIGADETTAAGTGPETWDYVAPMQAVAANYTGQQGVVLHMGDSITYAFPYGAWAKYGEGKTSEDVAALSWSHVNEENNLDGWWLASYDYGPCNSYTAASGITAGDYIIGGWCDMPSLNTLIQTYNPQMVVLMLGTNDSMQGQAASTYRANMETIVQSLLGNGTIVILSTIPPMIHNLTLAEQYNDELWLLAESYGLPLIDFYGEIVTRRPGTTWNGTLLALNDVHPTGDRAGVTVSSAPTEANLRECGYLLRGWLSVRKVVEVKARVID